MKTPEEVSIAPSIVGSAGQAWLVDMDALCTSKGITRDQRVPVACWVIEAPWAHPFWHSYLLYLIHLRPVPGAPVPTIFLKGATHEIVLFALNPDSPREPQINGNAPLEPLVPPNFAAQIIAEHDASAMERVEHSVRAICNGTLSPDADFRSSWVSLYGNNMISGFGPR